MGQIAKGVNKINFTLLYGNYCYIIIENFHKEFSPCGVFGVADYDSEVTISKFKMADSRWRSSI